MKINKNFLLGCCQGWQNTYHGKHGKVDFSMYDDYGNYKHGIDEGYWAVKGNELYIFEQGTDEWREWASNLKIAHIHLGLNSKIAIEQGFLEAYKTGRDYFMKLIKNKIKKHNIKYIIWSGHSRGAAIGTIGARDTKYHIDKKWKLKNIKVILVTGGSPRVYNHYGANEFNNSGIISYRLVYRNDIVTRIPWNVSPKAPMKKVNGKWRIDPPIATYCHVGKLLWLGKFFFLSPIGMPQDHAPQKYTKGMKKYTKMII